MATPYAPATINPRWLTLPQAAAYSGIGERCIQNYLRAGHIRSSNCRAPGATRGRRLIDRESLDNFILAGVSAEPSPLAMNLNRAKRACTPA
ncbi:MAG: helix-turn-helix domain-containing protein [Verrucomicrobia bacterium]|nr:helix-turn-helix domain-containing protein [Verrucomicrobiota bacterium]